MNQTVANVTHARHCAIGVFFNKSRDALDAAAMCFGVRSPSPPFHPHAHTLSSRPPPHVSYSASPPPPLDMSSNQTGCNHPGATSTYISTCSTNTYCCTLWFSTGKGGSVGSRGSRRLTGRGSVGFALAPLDEVESMRVEVVSGVPSVVLLPQCHLSIYRFSRFRLVCCPWSIHQFSCICVASCSWCIFFQY